MTLAEQIQAAAADVHAAWTPTDSQPSDDPWQRMADAAVDGVLAYERNGWQTHRVGRQDIDWTSNLPHHGTQVRYRMRYIVALTKAYQQSRDERYALAAHDYIFDFIRAAPSTDPWTMPDRCNVLDLSGWLRSWGASLAMLAESDHFPEQDLARIVEAMRVHTNYLVEHIAPGINWRVFNADAILQSGLWLRFLPEAARWRMFSVRVLNDAYHRQFHDDGSHFEHNPGYHRGMMNVMTNYWRLARVKPDLGMAMTTEQIARMHDYAIAVTRPNGFFNGMHDIQGDRVGRTDNAMRAARTRFHAEAGLPDDLPATSQYFPDAGQALLRTDWSEDAEYVTFDATNWGDGHCHLSRNAIQIHSRRRTMIADPGWLSYEDPVWGPHGKSTRAHSTCNLNGWSQLPVDPARTRHHHIAGYDAVHSFYEGGYYDADHKWNFAASGPGIWAQHGRLMLWVHRRFLFVVDSMWRLPRIKSDPVEDQPSYECNWQLCEGASIDMAADASRANARWDDAGLLMLFPIRPEGARLSVHEGETDPPRGWVPKDGRIPAPLLALTTPRMSQRHDYYASVLIPYGGDSTPQVTVEAKSPMGRVGYVKLRWADGSIDEVHWGCNFNIMIGEVDGMCTDSSLVHVRREADGRVAGAVIQGTYMEPYVEGMRSKPETFAFTG